MHSIVLLTALTATTGIFGGHKSKCGGGSRCGGRQVMAKHHSYAAPVAPCATASCYSAPASYYPTPAPAPQATPAMPTPPVAPKTTATTAPGSYYVQQSYYYAPTSPCANGQCYRR